MIWDYTSAYNICTHFTDRNQNNRVKIDKFLRNIKYRNLVPIGSKHYWHTLLLLGCKQSETKVLAQIVTFW